MTFAEILSQCYERLNFAASPASAVVTRIKGYVNEVHEELLSIPGMQSLLYGTITFPSVASQAVYGLPPSIARIIRIRETTNDLTLHERSLGWYRAVDPDPASNTGTPDYYIRMGPQAVAVQPSDASEIFVDSTSASDTNTAYLEGIITGGYKRTLSVSMTGTTAVSFSAAVTSFIELHDFYLSAAAVGVVTLHEDASGGTELARIGIGQTRSRYQGIALYPTPSAVVTYTVDCERDLSALVEDKDEPVLPLRFHRLLALGARVKEYEKTDDDRFDAAQRDFKRGVDQLVYHVTCSPDYTMVPGGRVDRGSNLGPMFPSGRW